MGETRCIGRSASPGVAIGTLFVLETAIAGRRGTGTPEQEDTALGDAIEVAKAELAELIGQAEGEAADILSFQVAMLEDEELAAPARAEIAGGVAADLAWRNALDAQIADYAASDDEYFRARVSDLADIRDRVLQHLSGAQVQALPGGAVIAAEDITPSRFLSHDWKSGGAIVLSKGSPSSHVAMLARARHVPMVVGVDFDTAKLKPGAPAIVDGAAGVIILDPEAESHQAARTRVADDKRLAAEAQHFLKRPAVTGDGSAVAIYINVASPDELAEIDPAICDGIGLVRTELLFHGHHGLPDEEQQHGAYKRILDWAAGRPVIVRTLDAGGDKPIPGLTIEESNPFLGLRGLRLSLKRPEVFRTQLRALCRAAVAGELKIMLPMVTVPAELAEARAHLDAVVVELAQAGIAHRRPPLGIMVEVPSVAVTPERFAADFFSIGSNDLTQYVMAAARDLNSVAHLADTGNPAVLALITRVAAQGAARGIEVSLCGDAASDPALVPHLLRCGLRKLSAAPAAVGRVKAAIAGIDLRS
ncbi:phosphoenolpyruvate--protein phosphotransferase [Dongia sedimenti]|uniref:Phosphoenolpyruvate-protein phosphotransferase n=1 Tax=Dongia sedimenti TaxID=3064282 RepID=A0ABU0YWC6_9PROT|nr:phosphoenolpyruvate--protein phosphotransferase [Rhodospirillaceae bacterium R-7]